MLKRKAYERLTQWKTSWGAPKALLVTGARQIGKSYLIRHFVRENFSSYFEVNLLTNKAALQALSGAKSAADFINRVVLLSEGRLVEGDALVFVDEIQEYPDIVTIVKALVEDGRYTYAFSGSMLGTEFKGVS